MRGPGQNARASASAAPENRASFRASSNDATCNDQRVRRGPVLRGVDRRHRIVVRRVRPEAVDRLGREGDEPALPQKRRRPGDALVVRSEKFCRGHGRPRDAASRLRAAVPGNTLPGPDRSLKRRCHAIYRAHGRDQFHPRGSGGLFRPFSRPSASPMRTPDVSRAVLEEAGRLAERLAPLGPAGESDPARLENAGCAHPKVSPKGYGAIAEGAGTIGLAARSDRGGMGLPQALNVALNEYPLGGLPAARDQASADPGPDRGAGTSRQPEQQGLYLPKLVSGQWSGTMNLTEPQGRQRPRRARDEGRTRRRERLGDHGVRRSTSPGATATSWKTCATSCSPARPARRRARGASACSWCRSSCPGRGRHAPGAQRPARREPREEARAARRAPRR